VFVNPPYGRRKGQRCTEWVIKAINECNQGAEIIMLLPARTDTKWFQRLIDLATLDHASICFVRGRLTFKGQSNGAPFPSALVHLGKEEMADRFGDVFHEIGAII